MLAKVATSVMDSTATQSTPPVISLVSPPTINRTLYLPPSLQSEPNESISNLNDLQSTLEFSIDPALGSEDSDPLTPVSQALEMTMLE